MKYLILLVSFSATAAWVPGTFDLYEGTSKSAEYQTLPECKAAGEALTAPTGSIACRSITRYEPDPIPDPGPCLSDWESALAVVQPGEIVTVCDGDYPLADQQRIVIPGGITFRAQTRGKVRFLGGGRDWKPVLSFSGTGSVVDGIQILHPTGWVSAAASIRSTGSPNRVQNSVLASVGGNSKSGSAVGMGGGGELVNSVIFGKGRYTITAGNSQPGPVLIQGNIIRNDGPWVLDRWEPNSAIQLYGAPDVTMRHNIVVDTSIPEGAGPGCGDYCIGADIKNGVQIFSDNLLMEGNVSTHNTSKIGSNRSVHLMTKGGGRVTGGIIRDHYISHTRGGISWADPSTYPDLVIERCTTHITESDGNITTCGDNAVINWTWENEMMAFDAMCAPTERQSGWCISGKTLAQYAQE